MKYNLKRSKFSFSLAKWKSGLLGALRKCGLLSATTPETDIVCKADRQAVPGRTLVGDGATYLDTNQILDEYDTLVVDGRFKSTGGRMGSLGIDARFYFGHNLTTWIAGFGSITVNDGTPDLLRHVFKINKNGFYVDENLVSDFSGYIFNNANVITTWLLNRNGSADACDFDVYSAYTIKDGVRRDLVIEDRDDTGVIALKNPNDNNDQILGEQFLSPAVPTVPNTSEVSWFDLYGGTIAGNGTHWYDQAKTQPVPQGTLMSASKSGYLYTYDINGEHPIADSVGEIKKNARVVDGVVAFNVLDYTPESGTDQSIETEINKVTVFEKDADSFSRYQSGLVQLKPSTQYTIKSSMTTLVGVTEGFVLILDESNTQIGSMTFTSDSTMTDTFTTTVDGRVSFEFYATGATITAGTKQYDTKVFEGTTEPTNGVFESGNSIIKTQQYNGEVKYDTNNILYNADGSPKVISFDDLDNIVGNQLYVSEDKQTILFFEEPLTGECDHKARRYVDINEQFMVETSEGSGEYEPFLVDGEELWVLKEGVTIDE